MLPEIILFPNPRLRAECTPVEDPSVPEVRKLADTMLAVMYQASGLGLAAPQIGVLKRVFVMDMAERLAELQASKEDPDMLEPLPEFPQGHRVFVNPVIGCRSDSRRTTDEGCLSFPDQRGDVSRPDRVNMGWQDLAGKTHTGMFTGLAATCVQHECDHLDGRLFIDYLTPLKRQMIVRRMKKQQRERNREGA